MVRECQYYSLIGICNFAPPYQQELVVTGAKST